MTVTNIATIIVHDGTVIQCNHVYGEDAAFAASVENIMTGLFMAHKQYGIEYVKQCLALLGMGPTSRQVSNVIPFPNRNKPDNDAG